MHSCWNKQRTLLKQSDDCLLLLVIQRLRHNYRDRDVQITLLRWEFMNWHTLTLNLQHLSRLRDSILSKLHTVTVQVSQMALPANQGILQANAEVHPEIISVTREQIMLLLLKNDNHMTGIQIGVLVTLMLEGNLLSILHAALDFHRNHMRLCDQLVTVAHVAGLVVCLSLTAAFPARLLDLLYESRGKLHTLENDAATLAHRACVNMLRIISTSTVTVIAEFLSVNAEVHFATVVQILQCDGYSSLHILISLLSTKSTKAEDISERIEALLVSLLLSLLHAFFTLHIIYSSFVFIREAIIRCLDINELGFALVGFTLIRVVFQAQLSVRSLNL